MKSPGYFVTGQKGTKNMNESYGKKVSLKWLIYRILRSWKAILIWSIIVGFVLGLGNVGLQAIKLSDDEFIENAKLDFEREHASWVATKENLSTQLNNLEKAKERKLDYNEKSILMKIDPLRKNIASSELYVDYDYKILPDKSEQNPDLSNRILKSYATYMTNGEMYHYIINNLDYDIELRYLNEILSISVDYSNKMISLSVVHVDKNKCQDILNLAMEGIFSRYDAVRTAIDEHQITTNNQAAYETIDLSLEDSQEANRQYVSDIDIAIQKVNENLKKWSKEPEPQFAYDWANTIKGGIKMTIIGGIAMFLIMSVTIAVIAVQSDKLLNPDDMKNCFGLHLIGQLPAEKKKEKFAGISRAFAKMCGISTKSEEYGSLAKTIGSSIKSDLLARPELSCQTIAFVGTAPAEDMEKAITAMSIEGYKIVCATNVLTDATSVDKVSNADCVVLMEKQEKTLMTEVGKELTALKVWNKPLLGAVVLNTDALM